MKKIALFLVFTFAVPHPALAFRQQNADSKEVISGLEEALQSANPDVALKKAAFTVATAAGTPVSPSPIFSAAGLEETEVAQKQEIEGMVAALNDPTRFLADIIAPYLRGVPGVTQSQITEATTQIIQADQASVEVLAGHPELQQLVQRAFALSLILHADQPRARGDSRPYAVHVAGVVLKVLNEYQLREQITDSVELARALAAVWLHDGVEDGKKGRWGKAKLTALENDEAALRQATEELIQQTTDAQTLRIVTGLSKPPYDGSDLAEEIRIEAQYYRDLANEPLATQIIKAADFAFNLGDLVNHPNRGALPEDRGFPGKFFDKRLDPVLGFLEVAKINATAKAQLVRAIRASVAENNAKNNTVQAPPILTPAQQAELARAEQTYVAGLEETVEKLVEQLRGPDRVDQSYSSRLDAAYRLRDRGPAAYAAVPALIETLKDKDHYLRAAAARAIGFIQPVRRRDAAVEGLAGILLDAKFSVRKAAVAAIGQIGLQGKEYARRHAAMLRMIKDDPNRSRAVGVLGKMGSAGDRVTVPALIGFLESSDRDDDGILVAVGSAIAGLLDRNDGNERASLIRALSRPEAAIWSRLPDVARELRGLETQVIASQKDPPVSPVDLRAALAKISKVSAADARAFVMDPIEIFYTSDYAKGYLTSLLGTAQNSAFDLHAIRLVPFDGEKPPQAYSIVVKSAGEDFPLQSTLEARGVAVVELRTRSSLAQIFQKALGQWLKWLGRPADVGAVIGVQTFDNGRLALYV